MQVSKQDLPVQHDLVFLQVALTAQSFGVDGITDRDALGETVVQAEGLSQVALQLLHQATLLPLKPLGEGGQDQEQKRKYVHNTIAHISHAGESYIINGNGIVNVLRLLSAFLLHNHLLQYNLIFFVDGQRTLYTAILRAFAWLQSVQIILDWYHLEKRCKEQLSLALKGRVIRNTLLEQLCPFLWHGCVDRAIALLQAVGPDKVKNQEALDTLIGYLERNRPYLPCCAVRKRLGLRNSSNRGEKANDLIVSDRQKHNGMSWSKPGSVALAAITALVRNREYKRWFQAATLSFSFSPAA